MTAASSEIRDGFPFRGGRLGLDLAATLAGRVTGAFRERLATPGDLDRWLTAAGLAEQAAGASADDLALARDLREAIYDLATAQAQGRPPPKDARERLNAMAALPAAPPWLGEDGRRRLFGDARSLLAGVARDAVELLGGDDAGRVRQCEGATCAILFVDASRKGQRRWCSMAGCGNRAKAAAFRARERAGDEA